MEDLACANIFPTMQLGFICRQTNIQEPRSSGRNANIFPKSALYVKHYIFVITPANLSHISDYRYVKLINIYQIIYVYYIIYPQKWREVSKTCEPEVKTNVT